ncbi:NUMOD4 domain-containing protein [Spirosoma arboris]|nr:NUMOD4 domain-containing protein [Spirosoma arboris]
MWKPLVDYKGQYEVSDLGQIRSLQSGNIVRTQLSDSGTSYVTLRPLGSELGTEVCAFIDELVAKAFLANPKNYKRVVHIDGDLQNNKASNLRWNTDVVEAVSSQPVIANKPEELCIPVKINQSGKPVVGRRKVAISIRFRLRPVVSGKGYHYTHPIQTTIDKSLGQKPSLPAPIQIRITVEGQEDGGFYLRWPEFEKPNPLLPWDGEVVTVDRKLWDQKERKLKGRHSEIIAFNDELRKTELCLRNILLIQKQRHKSGIGPLPTVRTVKEEYTTGQPPAYSGIGHAQLSSRDSLLNVYQAYCKFLLSQKSTQHELSANTLDKWEYGLNYLKRYLGEIGQREIRATEVNRNFLKRYRLWLLQIVVGNPTQLYLKKLMKKSTAAEYCGKVQKVLEYLQDENIAVDAGAITMKFERSKGKSVYYLAPEHIDRLFTLEVDKFLSPALWWIKLMCLTGLDYKDAKLYIQNRQAYERDGTEGRKIVITRSKKPCNECHIYMLPELDELLSQKVPKAYVLGYFNKKSREIAKLIGFQQDFTSKICRKTAGNLMLRRGFSMAGVAGIMGHSNVTTTMKHYVKTDGALVDEEYKSIVFKRASNRPFSQIHKAA